MIPSTGNSDDVEEDNLSMVDFQDFKNNEEDNELSSDMILDPVIGGGSSEDIRCVCSNEDDDGFTIQCEDCLVWQHAVCVGITKENVPESYFCDLCRSDLHQKVFH